MKMDTSLQCDDEESAAVRKAGLRGFACVKVGRDTFKVMNGVDRPMCLHRADGTFTRAQFLEFANDLASPY